MIIGGPNTNPTTILLLNNRYGCNSPFFKRLNNLHHSFSSQSERVRVAIGTLAFQLTAKRYFKASDFIKVHIGPEKVSWSLPRDLLAERMPGLKSVIEPSSGEKKTVGIHLKAEDPKAFALMVDWLLTGKLECDGIHDAESNHDLLPLCNLLTLANDLKIEGLSNMVIEQVKKCLRQRAWLPNEQEIRHVFGMPAWAQRMKQIIFYQTLDAYLSSSADNFRRQAPEWSKIMAASPAFHIEFLIALKNRLPALQVEANNTDSPEIEKSQKRKRCGNLEAPNAQGGEATATHIPRVDLTGETSGSN